MLLVQSVTRQGEWILCCWKEENGQPHAESSYLTFTGMAVYGCQLSKEHIQCNTPVKHRQHHSYTDYPQISTKKGHLCAVDFNGDGAWNQSGYAFRKLGSVITRCFAVAWLPVCAVNRGRVCGHTASRSACGEHQSSWRLCAFLSLCSSSNRVAAGY